MKRYLALASVLAVAVVLAGSSAMADDKDKKDKDDKPASIADVMAKAHDKDDGLRVQVLKAVKGKDWDTAATKVKEWVKLGDDLAKNKPEKGSPASWKKLTGSYNKTLTTLSGAVEKKNASQAAGALGQIGKSCGTCHKAHKP